MKGGDRMEKQVIYTRLPLDLHRRAKRYIEAEKKRRMGAYSYTTFLAEAVFEKLVKEGIDHAKNKKTVGD
jgi:HEPN domain-containing protein